MNKNRLNIIIISLNIFITSCSCGSGIDKHKPFSGSTYPDEINIDETVPTGNLFYVDPVNGDINNDGGEDQPWSTMQEVMENNLIETREYKDHPYTEDGELIIKNPGAPVKAGDTLILRTGFHGELFIQDYFNEEYINIIAQDGHTPAFSMVHLQAAAKWRMKGITVSPELGVTYETGAIFFLESHGWHGPVYNITIDNCTIYSVQDISGWSADDWNNLSCDCILADGSSFTIRNNICRNVDFGISVSGTFMLVKDNTVENFEGDGLRGIGNDMFFEYNTVKNCYFTSDNHDDGFQSWSINDDPPRERIVLRGNTIINYEDPGQPFRGALQGIGCFDGPYIDWVIENNLVITDHWHGISFYGAKYCRIVNNTVLDINNVSPGPCWIMITDHKDGWHSENCIIRNNIANSIIADPGVSEDHNYVLSADNYPYTDIFADLLNYDCRLKAGAPVIDAGSSDIAPSIDILQNRRPHGRGYDIGAYEYY